MSRLRRVGADVDAEEYWQERAASYSSGIAGRYHAHRLAVIESLMQDIDPAGLVCVDFGCGDGVHLEALAGRGATVIGLDPVEEMVTAAQERLAKAQLSGLVSLGGIAALGELGDGSADLLLALNVMAYFTDEEEAEFYAQVKRVLRPGGHFVVTHSNELFDLYTLNRYTAAFAMRHFGTDVEELLVASDKPDRITFNVRENPLSYGFKLARHGLAERRQEFINLHPAPPLQMDQRAFEDLEAREYPDTLNWPPEERWKLLFQCSMFASLSERAGG